MILTPIPFADLPDALDRLMAGLDEPSARAALARIRGTASGRSTGDGAARDRQAALTLARRFGVPVHPEGVISPFNWDGVALDGSTEAYVILHEVAHFLLAPPERRQIVDFGLGPGPDTKGDTTARAAAEAATVVPFAEREADEALASLLGILWEAELGQPALASFLDQNWLEGLDRSAAAHFTAVLHGLRRRGLIDAQACPLGPDGPNPAFVGCGMAKAGPPWREA